MPNIYLIIAFITFLLAGLWKLWAWIIWKYLNLSKDKQVFNLVAKSRFIEITGASGSGILALYPFTELVVSKLEAKLKNKENKWKEFLTDADTFLDNYNELLGIITQFEINELNTGIVSKKLKNLDQKIKKFLETYDEDKNNEIDVEELIKKRNELSADLNKGKKESELWKIINAIKSLEEAIIDYRRHFYYEETIAEENNRFSQSTNNLLNQSQLNLNDVKDLNIPQQVSIEVLTPSNSITSR